VRACVRLGLGIVAAVVALSAIPSRAQDRRVYVGVYLHDVTRFDQKDGVFDVDLELWAKWLGELDPQLVQIANAADVDRQFLGVEDDRGWHSARWRVRGTLRGEFPLHSFPFDRQTIAVELELPEQHGILVPDLASSGMAERFSITDWDYEPEFDPEAGVERFASDLGNLSHEGAPATVRRVAYRVTLSRPIVPVILKLFLPLGIIVLVALLSLFVSPDNVEVRSAMGVTALLSCFAFQFTVSDSLPAVAYLTLADSLFLLGYVLSTGTVVETIAAYVLDRHGRSRAAIWLDRVARVVLPVAALVTVYFGLPENEPARADEPAPMPEMPRHASARDTLRIGTNVLPSITGSPLSFGGSWGLVHDDPDLGDQVVHVERQPGVDNDLVRFLAGGEIEVTWRIRDGMKWSDGQPLRAADVLFALEASPEPHIVESSAPDERTVVLRWDDRLARALEAPWVLPDHALRSVFETPGEGGEPGGYDAVKAHRESEPTPILGPYRVIEHVAGERMVAEANAEFPGAAPNIRRIELVRYADQAAVRAAFEAGEIDISVPNSVTVEDALAVREARPDVVHIRASAVLVFLSPDLAHPLLGQHEVRRALLMAIDRERLAREAYPDDTARVAHVPVPGELPRGAEVVPYDPALARAELARLGVREVTLPLLHVASSQNDVTLGIVVGALEAAGVRLELREVPSTLSAWRDGGHGGLVLHVLRASRDSDPRRYFQVPLVDGKYDSSARHDAYTDEVHRLVERELRALYPERRDQLRSELYVEYSRRLPALPLIFAAERFLVDSALRDWQTDPEVAFGTGMEKWWFAQ
jgi:ABC-type transport system substrate-binding protein